MQLEYAGISTPLSSRKTKFDEKGEKFDEKISIPLSSRKTLERHFIYVYVSFISIPLSSHKTVLILDPLLSFFNFYST